MPISVWRNSPDPLFAAVDVPHFPAQSLSAWNPALRKLPFAVVEQTTESHKTPLLALSRSAREMGVMPGMPVFIARRRWPRLKILTRDSPGELRLRKAMETLFLSFTPVFALRESGGALLDLTGTPLSRNKPPEDGGKFLREKLRSLGLESVSMGIAASQSVARVLARRNQPDGVQVCARGDETALLDPLSPELLPGLSPHCRELLRKCRLVFHGQRAAPDGSALRFGKEGDKLYTSARGLDLEILSSKAKSVGAETVLSRDVNDQETLCNQVRLTADKLGHALRLQKAKAAKVTLLLTYSDKRSVRRTLRLRPPTAAFPELSEKAVFLFEELYQRRVALRRIQLQVTSPQTDTGQIELFDTDSVRKQNALEEALDKIRRKRNFETVLNACNVKPSLRQHPSSRK